MFKKTLIALALTSAAMSANAANVIDTTNAKNAAHVISLQSLTAAKTTTVPSVDVELDEDYLPVIIAGAKVIVSVSGAVFNSGITADLSGSLVSTADPVNAGSSLTYTIDSETFTADGDTFSIPALPVILDSVDSTVKYTVSFTTAGGAAISGATAAETSVASIVNEWSVSFSNLNNQIDVADDRETFVGGGSTDTLGLNFSDIDLTTGGADLVSATVTVKGDFTDIVSVADASANAYTINTAKTEATFTYTTLTTPAIDADDLNAIDETLTLTVKSGTAAVSLKENSFTASVDVKYDGTKTIALATDKAVGSWTLNSSSTTITYAPMGPNTQLIVNATSSFGDDASVDVSYLAADGSMDLLEDVATVNAKSVTKLGDTISAAVLADMGTTSAKTKLVVSVNAPEGNVVFFTGFKDKTDGSRMMLEQVDVVANDTLAAAEAAQADLANTTDGLTALSATITTNGIASKTAAVDTFVAAKVGAPEAYSATDVAAMQSICASMSLNFETTDASDTLVVAGAAALTNGCY